MAEIPDDLSIPAFLKIPDEVRKAAWENVVVRSSWQREEKLEGDQRLREAIEAERAHKRAQSLARFKEQHAGERWDAKAKIWVRDPEALRKLQEAEFAEHAAGGLE